MDLPYRLDLSVDLFTLNIDGVAVILGEAELARLRDALTELRSCWPAPKDAQVWATVERVLGRDPRRS